MRNYCRPLKFIVIVIHCTTLYSGWWSDTVDSLSSSFSFVKEIAIGMAESFGMNPPGYNTSIQVYNNSEVPVEVVLDRMKKYQGVTFHQGTIKTIPNILPGHDTGSALSDIDLYLRVVLRASSDGGQSYGELFSDMIVSQEPQYYHCNYTYVYNFYSSPAGTQTEYLGCGKTTTQEFFAQIYNGLNQPCFLRYTINSEVFTVVLEPQTFNFLQSDPTNAKSMRPGNLIFTFADGSTQTVALSSYGLANQESQVGSSGKDVTTATPMQYHYEIYSNSAGKAHVYCTGLGQGNYKMATNGNIRQISPVTCCIWNKSADQVQQYSEYIAIEGKKRKVWFAYGTPGWADITTGVKNIIMGSIPYGQAVNFKFIRPTVFPTKASLQNGSLFTTAQLTPRDVLTIKDLDVDKEKSNLTGKYYIDSQRIIRWNGTITSPLTPEEQDEQAFLGELLEPVNLYEYAQALSTVSSKAELYVVSLNTDDDTKAQQFMTKLVTGVLSCDYAQQDSVVAAIQSDEQSSVNNTLSNQTAQTLMSGNLKTDYAIIKDPETGVEGHILIKDIFLPYGNTMGPYYYSVEPPIQSVSYARFSWLQTYLTQDYFSATGNAQAFSSLLQQWLKNIYDNETIEQGLQAVAPDITSFLQQNGVDTLFNVVNGTVNRQALNDTGNTVLMSMLCGPSSVVNSPLYWTSGISWYSISATLMPMQNDPQTNTLVSAWNPSSTITLNAPSSTLQNVADNKLGLSM